MIRSHEGALRPVPDTGYVLPVDKPIGWSSFDVVRWLRRRLPVRKIGHAGTLDPMATGLLLCGVGRATRSLGAFMALPKTYQGRFRLGAITPSYDAETPITEERPWEHVRLEAVRAAAQRFVGRIAQVPPPYSAVKQQGTPAYLRARRGEAVTLEPRLVEVYAFEILQMSGPEVVFWVHCGKGVYVRALVHELGQILGVGAYLTELRRTAVGPYRVEEAWTIPDLERALAAEKTP
ncbi:MAG: tRNA pseudouridine(55) synthase TruB [Bacteroidetes bacterium]|nr:tRNA pseudouridine(55) synthase TruB [Rhodothermia bacterium]MCS7154827.1 tRNA pseudouridine(55) synthase TruB [Bacteroidota bacterium]MCX7907015.1 tRNA pseudouridine(55) synthase TruB [Bacteroidota bacterium]MDW8137621.1 tRNA pseudouridine(55) synthase TruB [Bacteroidota bacterium]MDW8285425.1 tRNA pseudouridine(55) synthase TruB [Bacteroidota bacterium]